MELGFDGHAYDVCFLLDCIIISSSLLPSHDFLSHLFISLLKVLHHSMIFRYTSIKNISDKIRVNISNLLPLLLSGP